MNSKRMWKVDNPEELRIMGTCNTLERSLLNKSSLKLTRDNINGQSAGYGFIISYNL